MDVTMLIEGSVRIRTAMQADAAELVALNRGFDEQGSSHRDRSGVEEFLANPGTEVVLVAELKDRQLVGFATLQITQSFCYTRPAAELTGIYVRPAHRRSGVGSLLVQEVVRRAEAANVLELFLRVNRANSRAIAFYKNCGLEEANHFEYRIVYYTQQTQYHHGGT